MFVQSITYSLHHFLMEGVLIYDDRISTPRPGLIMAPDWWGINDNQINLAKEIAGQDYVIFIADFYGANLRPKNTDEATAAVQALYNNRAELKARMQTALETLKSQEDDAPLNGQYATIGFCFGGTASLDLARNGADIKGVVTFHGLLGTDDPTLAHNIKAKVLVLNGAEDTMITHADMAAFEEEMRGANIDWQLINYGEAVHCFSIPTADGIANPNCKYHERTAKRAFTQMSLFLREVFS